MDSASQTEENVSDPFAADIFATKQKPGGETAAAASAPANKEAQAETRWTRRLKKFPPPATDWSKLLAALPADFSESLSARLSAALREMLVSSGEKNEIDFLPLAAKEINRAEDFPLAETTEQSWWLGVGVEPSEIEIAVEIADVFAAWLVDAALQLEEEKVSEKAALRELTESEKAVLEFLSLNLAYEANRALRSPLFKIRSFNRQAPEWLENARRNFAAGDSILTISRQLVFRGEASSSSSPPPNIVRIYLTPDALKSLSADENSLLSAATQRRADWRRSRNRIEDLRMRLLLGRVELTLAELASLETGDVVLLEDYSLTFFGGELFGRADIFAGDGEGAKISGEILSSGAAAAQQFEENGASADNKILVRNLPAGEAWKFVVTDLAQIENATETAGQIMAEQDENLSGGETNQAATGGAGEGDESGLALENLALTLRVELEARRLTLAEIAELRENQILELGVRPTDPVNLLLENRVVGRGELVEIEERLGVRITKLLR